MKKELMNLFLFIGVCFVFYLLFRNFNFSYKEGLETTDTTTTTTTTDTTIGKNGIAGNAAAFAASIKEQNIKFQDQFLISKYRSDYEAVILDLDELVDNLMLKTILIPSKNPEETLEKIGELNQSKVALNSIMKFVDKK